MRKLEKISFEIFSEDCGEMSEKVKNDEKGQIWQKKVIINVQVENSFFHNFFRKLWKNVEKSGK